jgi:RNA polymerase sigma-70 factor (ECF subfamily)
VSASDAEESSSSGNGCSAGAFVTTHWSVVLSAQEKDAARSAEALELLCRSYWYPLYAFVRRQGHSPHDAQDLTQGFFARLLEKDYLKSAAQAKGKFRTFLLVALKRYLANEWDRQHAAKRGGFSQVISIDQELAEARFASEPFDSVQPDLVFDRQWAIALLERTMKRLEQEYMSTGRSKLFETLRGLLTREDAASPYAELASRLNLTESAVKMAVYRLRGRYREILHAEIAETVASAQQVEEEIRELFAAFRS